MSSRFPKRSRQSTGSTTSYSTSRRPRRSAGGASSTHHGSISGALSPNNLLGVPSQKYTKVMRHPTSPLDEPYFGSSPTASFKIPMWVRIDELTDEERNIYDEEEGKKKKQRLIWQKELAARNEEEKLLNNNIKDADDTYGTGTENDETGTENESAVNTGDEGDGMNDNVNDELVKKEDDVESIIAKKEVEIQQEKSDVPTTDGDNKEEMTELNVALGDGGELKVDGDNKDEEITAPTDSLGEVDVDKNEGEIAVPPNLDNDANNKEEQQDQEMMDVVDQTENAELVMGGDDKKMNTAELPITEALQEGSGGTVEDLLAPEDEKVAIEQHSVNANEAIIAENAVQEGSEPVDNETEQQVDTHADTQNSQSAAGDIS